MAACEQIRARAVVIDCLWPRPAWNSI